MKIKNVEYGNIECQTSKEYQEIKEVLKKFQNGYTRRNKQEVDGFVEELFIIGDDTHVLGTGTGELFLGSEQVKNLIRDDWEYWGDVNIDWENAHISTKCDSAWFAVRGNVKYTFEDKPERYDSYVSFIQRKADEEGLNPKEKLAFINWVLALTYHQRLEKKREYLWPIYLSGKMLQYEGKWKFSQLQFSQPRPDFPDERFECSEEYLENFKKQNEIAALFSRNQMTEDLRDLFRKIEKELIGQENVSEELVNKYFAVDELPYIIGDENKWYYGTKEIREFFNKFTKADLDLDLEHSIASSSGNIIWVTAVGLLTEELSEDEVAENTLKELKNLLSMDSDSKEKLFAVHRSVAYALKESAVSNTYTWPVRLTAITERTDAGLLIHYIHFSYPSYWIFEGKIDGE